MERLRDARSIGELKQFLGQHLGRHYSIRLGSPFKRYTEAEKINFIPLIFGLLPRSSVYRASPYDEVKPQIRTHLQSIGLEHDELLVDIFKDLSDNYYNTRPSEPSLGFFRPRKPGIADLRQMRQTYSEILDRQKRRCATCGIEFVGSVAETLDHIIPWRLGGDPPDGSNWQLLCKRCNDAKSHAISSVIFPEYYNWVYSDAKEVPPDCTEDRISLRSRYLLLSVHSACQVENCGKGPTESELVVVRRTKTGFTVLDHLSVLCKLHADQQGLSALVC